MAVQFELPAGRPAVMGILNATPDSFSDGGAFSSYGDLLGAALAMLDDGADLIDVGGESTRPGAAPVSEEEEWNRVGRVVTELASRGTVVSIDTQKPAVAGRALDAGAWMVNDVGGLRDSAMAELVVRRKCPVCLMHMQGDPQTMQIRPQYDDVVSEVSDFLIGTADRLASAGLARETTWIDPGFGFGKKVDDNLALLRNLEVLVGSGYPVLVGVSRKSIIGSVMGNLPVSDRLEGTLAVQAYAQLKGARVLRVHDVKPARRVVDMLAAIVRPG